MTIEQQRAEFEAWISKFDGDEPPYIRDENERYDDWHIQRAWSSWQAAIASVSAQPVELTDQEIVTVIGIQGMFADEVDICRAVLAAQRAKDKGAV